MTWYTVMGTAATFGFLLPIAIIIRLRLYTCPALLVLMLNYSLSFIFNLMTCGILPVSASFQRAFGITTNILDTPMMLIVLLFFCSAPWKMRMLRFSLIAFIAYELVILFTKGFTIDSVVYILGPGVGLIVIYSFVLFVQQIKDTIVHNKRTGRSLMIASIFFSYGSYAFIYLFYYIEKTNEVRDVFLLFFIASTISAVLMSFGLVFVNKRLTDLKELKNTRRELQMFFSPTT
jgi:hypothetical protein